MHKEFEDWAKGRTMIVTGSRGEYKNSEVQLLWDAWSTAWMMACRLQNEKDQQKLEKLELRFKKLKTLLKQI